MGKIIDQRMTVEIEGDFVVFLIGMRINKLWKLHKWLPVFLAMPRMVKELRAHPELGCLGVQAGLGTIIQYWRSFDHLEAYAQSREQQHLPAWKDFNQRIGKSKADVGIWHETYQIRSGEYEAVYSGMPVHGLGAAGNLVSASGHRATARDRLKT